MDICCKSCEMASSLWIRHIGLDEDLIDQKLNILNTGRPYLMPIFCIIFLVKNVCFMHVLS